MMCKVQSLKIWFHQKFILINTTDIKHASWDILNSIMEEMNMISRIIDVLHMRRLLVSTKHMQTYRLKFHGAKSVSL